MLRTFERALILPFCGGASRFVVLEARSECQGDSIVRFPVLGDRGAQARGGGRRRFVEETPELAATETRFRSRPA